MPEDNRRTFLRGAGLAAAGSFLNLNPAARGANEKVTLALIGARNQGRGDASRAIAAGARVKTICDLDPAIIAKVSPDLAKRQGSEPGSASDYRQVLDDKDIDAVIIAVPDHWHAIMAILACQAGKDVYCEKPLSQTIHEGHLVREAVRKHNRVMQVGTQRRSMRALRRSGRLRGLRQAGQGLPDPRLDVPDARQHRPPARRHPARRRGLRPLARSRPQAPLQPDALPLQLAVLLGLRQQRTGQPGRAHARRGHLGHPEAARHGPLPAHARFRHRAASTGWTTPRKCPTPRP